MRGPVYKYGDMVSQWNHPRTAFIPDADGTVLGYLALQLVAHRVAGVLGKEEDYSLRLFTPEQLRENGYTKGGPSIMCHFGLMQSKTLQQLQDAVGSLFVMAEDEPTVIFNVEFPGRHRLVDTHVVQALRQLPNNVHIWRPATAAPRTRQHDTEFESD